MAWVMRTRAFSIPRLAAPAVALAMVLAAPQDARADCVDQKACICPAVANVAAVGVIEMIGTEQLDSGVSLETGAVRIEKISRASETDTRFFEGQVVDVSLTGEGADIGDRVLAFAHSGDDSMSLLHVVGDDGTVSCSGGKFTDDEARELIVADDCREQVEDRVVTSSCDDTSYYGCAVSPESDEGPSGAWWLLASLGLLAFRRRAQGSSRS
jgi:MYXO-CTERM domain-containing protein